MKLVGLVGSESGRESLSFVMQTRHGFCIAYTRDEVEEMRGKGIQQCLLFSTSSHDYDYVRGSGALIFVGEHDDCRIGDYVFLGRSGNADYSYRVADLVWAICDEEQALSPA